MSLSTGIASTPAQKVSLDDLTSLGLDRLQAMASGQQSSIAPSYLVIAAIEALKKGKAGVQQPQPRGTVKDQLLASLQPKPMPTPPSAMGIGAMAQQPQPPAQPAPPQAPQPPVQGMAEGGSVQHFETGGDVARQAEDRKRIKDILRGFGDTAVDAVDAGADLVSAVPRGIAGALNSSVIRGANAFGADIPYIPDVEGANYESMTPYTDFRKRERAEEKNNREGRIGTERGRATNRTSAESPVFRAEPPPMADLPVPDVSLLKTDPIAAAIAGSARSRGVGAYQGNAAKLKGYDGNIPDMPDPSSFKLDIPKNQALIDAAAKFSKPDEARMKELRAAEENAGLAAFGAGMIKPGGSFGGVFAGAVRDAVNAKETKAEKRREYEDKREMLATQLGIKVGDDARQDFLAQSEWGSKRAQEAFERGANKVKMKFDAAKAENNDALEAEKIKVQWARIREDAAARSDSKMLQLAERVARNQQEVGNRAYTMAIEKMKAAKPADAAIDPMWESRVTFNANKERARAEDQYMATAGAELLRRAGMGK